MTLKATCIIATTAVIFPLFSQGVLGKDGWNVTYTSKSICALNRTSVDLPCTYTYPSSQIVNKTVWFKYSEENVEPEDLANTSGYKGRVEYLGDKKHNCTLRVKDLRGSDSGPYYFRFITSNNKYTGKPGSCISVTDLQVRVNPDTVTEGESVKLTCNTTCTLSDSPAFIWYKNGHPLFNTNQNLQFSASSEDAGSYSCAVRGYEHLSSTAVTLNVTYAPKNTSVSVSASGKIVEGSSVTLTCSSNANPPVQRYTWFKNNRALPSEGGSGQNYSITNIRSEDSGQYYCEAMNKCGAQNSTAVFVTIKENHKGVIYAAVGSMVLVAPLVVSVIAWMRRRNSTKETEYTDMDRKESEIPVYDNVSGKAMTHNATQNIDRDNDESLYSTVQPAHSSNQEEILRSSDELANSENQDDVQYVSVRFTVSSSATRPPVQTVEEESVLYSTVNTKSKT